jgi:DNA ligase-associated metallophosphoesterase
MHQLFQFRIKEQTCWLSPERCLFWDEQQILIVSDIHFGKSGHFRSEGIGIPQTVFKEDLQRLFAQIQFFKPRQLIIVGDFFHSRINNEVLLFEKWRKDIAALPIQLVKGNHDILDENWYSTNNIQIHHDEMQTSPFTFVHEAGTTVNPQQQTGNYIFSGHIHPGVRIEGLARQSLCFPCFYFAENYAVLPAFGRFTGLHAVKPKKKDHVFAIVNKKILDLSATPYQPIN